MTTDVCFTVMIFQLGWKALPIELQSEVSMYLTLRELLIMASSEEFRDLAHAVLLTRLRDIFVLWGLPIEDTFAMMNARNVILSGSVALHIAFISSWFPGDLDFYCPSTEYEKVIPFFVKAGYSLEQTEGNKDALIPYVDINGIGEVATLVHRVLGVKINVVSSLTLSPFTPIFFFHSTVVMNAITSQGVVSFYPSMTARRRGIRNHARSPDPMQWNLLPAPEIVVLEKYRARGFAIADDCDHLFSVSPSSCALCNNLFRSSADKAPWRMSFVKGARVELVPSFQWKLGTARIYRTSVIVHPLPETTQRPCCRLPIIGPTDANNQGHDLVPHYPPPKRTGMSTVQVFEILDLQLPLVHVEGEDLVSEWKDRMRRRSHKLRRRIDQGVPHGQGGIH